MRRLAIAFFYDKDGIIDDYMVTLLGGLRTNVSTIVFVSNGPITTESRSKIVDLVDEILIRDNVGFDVWAYKAALEHVGFDKLALWDEVILLNHTFYGPIYPFSEMFDRMDATSCDFWGMTAHRKMTPNPFTGAGVLPMHLNSHFIAIRKKMAMSSEFESYWRSMSPIDSYTDSILKHESRFTQHFTDLGFSMEVYLNADDNWSDYPAFIDVDESLLRRSPILKRRLFFHDPMFLEQNAVDLPRALRIIEETSDYPVEQIWTNILRTATLGTLITNASLIRVLPDISEGTSDSGLRIAVCAHVYYTEMLDEILSHARHIPHGYDFIATTSSEEKKAEIEERIRSEASIKNAFVLVVKQNRGRDMASLFIDCREFFLDDRYDLVCRLHTKKSPQVFASRGNLFKRHMFDNLLNSRGYVEHLIALFSRSPSLGLAIPPLVHISYPTLGHAWFANRPKAQSVAEELELNVTFDEHTPVGAFGTMFWFKPRALRKLFERKWQYDDFNAEPHHVDGGLAHVLERLIPYVAQGAGFRTIVVMCAHQAEHNYAMLEYKHRQLSSHFPNGDFRWQNHMLTLWERSGYAGETIKQAMRGLLYATERSAAFRYPKLARYARPLYQRLVARFRF
ncbi:rhamnan synthesis F family protein [Mesorhizobium sp. B2-7-2]|uniref:rhamnan synthesis F family protein n=1 Tax=Mesorhizobium sp. B2-7-2 TaxID=2589908 RepID=UPI001127F5A8|nr:rhamnan synthesis F family protein [Mesorhizobium sp. B2-7-2]TPJ28389.1 hypothetical protein FJ425_11715 [Mesorhizobium sp. B2-7-2]